MVVIRLARFGTKHLPRYRITVADQKYSATKRFIEVIGTFNPKPQGKDKGIELDMERVTHWMKMGAQPSDRVRSILRKLEAKK